MSASPQVWVVWALVSLFPIAFLIALGWAIRLVVRGRASLRWPSVTGEITTLRVDAKVQGRGRTYVPVIAYNYRVAGRECVGTKIDATFGHESWFRRGAEKVLEPYCVGTEVTVYYNPANPSESLLRPGAPGGMWMVIVAIVLGFAGVALVKVVLYD